MTTEPKLVTDVLLEVAKAAHLKKERDIAKEEFPMKKKPC